MYAHTCTHPHTHTHTHTHTHKRIRTNIHTYIHTYIHTSAHIIFNETKYKDFWHQFGIYCSMDDIFMPSYTLTHSQRIFAPLQYAGATARCKHYCHIESANRKRSYDIHGRPIVFNLTREN